MTPKAIPPKIEQALARCILTGSSFTADDVTADGAVTIDGTHEPNARQNGIGSMFNRAAKRGLIEWTGEVVRSRAPHRRGGTIRVWTGTEAGRLWAASHE
jgi:hypothetical protein